MSYVMLKQYCITPADETLIFPVIPVPVPVPVLLPVIPVLWLDNLGLQVEILLLSKFYKGE